MRWIRQLLGQVRRDGQAPGEFLQQVPGGPNQRAMPHAPRPVPPAAASAMPRMNLATPGLSLAAIGDLHGRSDLLEQIMAALDSRAASGSERLVEIYLGDYVDRGPDSRGVIDRLIARKAAPGREIVCLAGNHEAMLLGALRTDEEFVQWLSYGGASTLQSYGVQSPRTPREVPLARRHLAEAIPAEHLAFLQGLVLSYRNDNFFFAHAGVRPGVALERQSERDLLWIREAFLNATAPFGAVVVHGHTPHGRPVVKPNRISIDTGAYQSGILTCALISAAGLTFIDTRRT